MGGTADNGILFVPDAGNCVPGFFVPVWSGTQIAWQSKAREFYTAVSWDAVRQREEPL